jgi:hypothetical protein
LTNSAFSERDEHSRPKGDASAVSRPTSWRQPSLLPQTLVQARLDVGWRSPERVGMFSLEAWVPGTHELLAMEVHPAYHSPTLAQFLRDAAAHQIGVLSDLFDPPPF